MSLIVLFYSEDESVDADIFEKELNPDRSSVFGFESCRKSLWGHPYLKKLNLEYISRLDQEDIYVFDDDLKKLKRDLEIILENIQKIVEETNLTESFIEYRVLNALDYVRVAEKHKDKIGVYIG